MACVVTRVGGPLYELTRDNESEKTRVRWWGVYEHLRMALCGRIYGVD
jgi:hypothetical protein